MALVLPATFGMMALASPIIRLIYERHAFSPADTRIVASLLISYAPYIIFISILKIISNAFYATGDSKSPLLIILFQQAINVLLNMVLVERFGIDGIAYATSLSTALGSAVLIIVYYKKFGKVNRIKNIIYIGKIVIASFFMVIATNFTYNLLLEHAGFVISLLISIILASFIYIITVILMKIDIIDEILEKLKYKIGRK